MPQPNFNLIITATAEFYFLCYVPHLEKLGKAPQTCQNVSPEAHTHVNQSLGSGYYKFYDKFPWPNKRKQRYAQCASARMLRLVTMVTVTRIVCLDSARPRGGRAWWLEVDSHDVRWRMWPEVARSHDARAMFMTPRRIVRASLKFASAEANTRYS